MFWQICLLTSGVLVWSPAMLDVSEAAAVASSMRPPGKIACFEQSDEMVGDLVWSVGCSIWSVPLVNPVAHAQYGVCLESWICRSKVAFSDAIFEDVFDDLRVFSLFRPNLLKVLYREAGFLRQRTQKKGQRS